MAKKSKHYIWLTDSEDLLCAAEEGSSKEGKTLLLTNKRLILIQQLPNKELADIDDKLWKEFKTVSLRQAFWNSTISVTFSVETPSGLWVFKKIKKSIAVSAYRLMKNKEVAKREAVKPKPAIPPQKEAVKEPLYVDVKVPVNANPLAEKIPPPVVKENKPVPPAVKNEKTPVKDEKKETLVEKKEESSSPPATKETPKVAGVLAYLKGKLAKDA